MIEFANKDALAWVEMVVYGCDVHRLSLRDPLTDEVAPIRFRTKRDAFAYILMMQKTMPFEWTEMDCFAGTGCSQAARSQDRKFLYEVVPSPAGHDKSINIQVGGKGYLTKFAPQVCVTKWGGLADIEALQLGRELKEAIKPSGLTASSSPLFDNAEVPANGN